MTSALHSGSVSLNQKAGSHEPAFFQWYLLSIGLLSAQSYIGLIPAALLLY
jgi:hypothetical protein